MRATRVLVLVVEELLKVGKMAGVNGDLGGEALGYDRDQPRSYQMSGRPQDMVSTVLKVSLYLIDSGKSYNS